MKTKLWRNTEVEINTKNMPKIKKDFLTFCCKYKFNLVEYNILAKAMQEIQEKRKANQ